jgi:hypothetical protein
MKLEHDTYVSINDHLLVPVSIVSIIFLNDSIKVGVNRLLRRDLGGKLPSAFNSLDSFYFSPDRASSIIDTLNSKAQNHYDGPINQIVPYDPLLDDDDGRIQLGPKINHIHTCVDIIKNKIMAIKLVGKDGMYSADLSGEVIIMNGYEQMFLGVNYRSRGNPDADRYFVNTMYISPADSEITMLKSGPVDFGYAEWGQTLKTPIMVPIEQMLKKDT